MENITVLFLILREMSGLVIGVSESPRNGIPNSHRVDFASMPDEVTLANIYSVADGWARLAYTSDKTSIVADGLDTVVLSIAEQVFNYEIWRNYQMLASGQVNDGALEFATDTAGLYGFRLTRNDGQGAFILMEAWAV